MTVSSSRGQGDTERRAVVGSWVELSAARIWYRAEGDGDPVVLFHGGLTDTRDFEGNLTRLATSYQVVMPERRGHGHSPDVDGPLTVEVMAADMAEFVDVVAAGPVHVVGYSVGASVALQLAIVRPDLVRSLVAISGALGRDGWLVRPQAADPPEPLLQAYAEVSPDGGDHFRTVVAKAAAASEEPGPSLNELAGFTGEVLVIVGDDDFVSLRHAVDLYDALPNGALMVVPNASHLLLHEHGDKVVGAVADFLRSGHRATMLPIRRPNRGTTGLPESST